MRNLTALIAFILLTTFALPGFATDVDTREYIDIVGTAAVMVVPDEFVIRATVTNFDRSLEDAASATDASVAKLTRGLGKLGVQRKYVVSDEISVHAVTEGYREQGNFKRLGYKVSRDVMVVLHKAERLEPAMKVLFDVGVDRLSVTTNHTNIASFTENAQIQAANAARRKGKLLSSALGRTLGAAVAIDETSPAHDTPRNFVYTADTPDLGENLSLGKLRVQASVRVKFLLAN